MCFLKYTSMYVKKNIDNYNQNYAIATAYINHMEYSIGEI